jgi:hypothetical protein
VGETFICRKKKPVMLNTRDTYKCRQNNMEVRGLRVFDKNTLTKTLNYFGSNRYRQGLYQWNPRSSATQRKYRQMGLHKTKKLLLNKRNSL